MATNVDRDQLKKPTDLDLHCLQRQCISRFSRTRVKKSCLCNCIMSYTESHNNQYYTKKIKKKLDADSCMKLSAFGCTHNNAAATELPSPSSA